MRTAAAALCCTFLVAGACSSAAKPDDSQAAAEDGDEGDEQEIDVREIVREAKISLSQAIDAALAARPGVAIEAELEGEIEDGKREVGFEVVVLDPSGAAFAVTVDHLTGEVTEIEKETEAEELAELAEVRGSIPANALSLADLLVNAMRSADGTPYEIAFRGKKGPGEVRAKFVLDKEERAVTIDAKTGNVVPVAPKK